MSRAGIVVKMIMAAILLVGCASKTDEADPVAETRIVNALETDESAEEIQNHTKMYIMKSDIEGVLPQIFLDEDNKTFSFSYDVLSSYLNRGTYAENDGQLELSTDDGKYQYTFERIDDYTLRFDKKNSSEIKLIDKAMGLEIEDGAEFILKN